MNILQAIVLGLLQGLTEFFPISSSAHLELVPWLAGWDLFDGDSVLENTFDVALHVGTLAGATAYLRRDIARYAKALWYTAAAKGRTAHTGDSDDAMLAAARNRADATIAVALVLSVVPAALVGVALERRLLSLAEEPMLIAALLAVFGGLLWWSDSRALERNAQRSHQQFGLRDALGMGVAQALALLPGVSRSGITMTAGRWLNFERAAAARLAFLMSLPLIAGAGVYRAGTLAAAAPTAPQIAMFVVGGTAAAASSWVGVGAMLRLMDRPAVQSASTLRSPFALFAGYRIVVAAAVVLVVVTGLR